jgi:uncharacterized OsmC-like protein
MNRRPRGSRSTTSPSRSRDLGLRGTLGIDREAPVGFTDIRLSFAIDAPGTSEDDLAALRRKTERYCVVMQTLLGPPAVSTTWA